MIPSLFDLVDLSRSARSVVDHDSTTYDATRMMEAREINTRPSVLKDYIRRLALTDTNFYTGRAGKVPPYIPLRYSILIKIVKDDLNPASARTCYTILNMYVNPYLANVGASKNTYATLYREAIRCFPQAEGRRAQPTDTSNVK
jgi:kinesin family protein 2/24